MTYRDDLDALTARHASLEAELERKQRELAEITEMLAEAGRVRQAESYFERAPDLRRRQRRHLVVGALVVMLGSGAALGAAASAAKQSHRAEAAQMETRLVRIRSTLAARADARRLQAELEALRALDLIPVVAPGGSGVALVKSRGPELPAPGPLARQSAAREDER